MTEHRLQILALLRRAWELSAELRGAAEECPDHAGSLGAAAELTDSTGTQLLALLTTIEDSSGTAAEVNQWSTTPPAAGGPEAAATPPLAPPRSCPECFGSGIRPHQMDAPGIPMCACGRPSRMESGWCGGEHPVRCPSCAAIDPRPPDITRALVEGSLVLGQHGVPVVTEGVSEVAAEIQQAARNLTHNGLLGAPRVDVRPAAGARPNAERVLPLDVSITPPAVFERLGRELRAERAHARRAQTAPRCPCPRPEGLTDEQIRDICLPHGPGLQRWAGRDWHVVEWRRCTSVSRSLGSRCELKSDHHRVHRITEHNASGTPIYPGWTDECGDLVEPEPAFPVPCWVTTAEEAERWRPAQPEFAPVGSPPGRCGAGLVHVGNCELSAGHPGPHWTTVESTRSALRMLPAGCWMIDNQIGWGNPEISLAPDLSALPAFAAATGWDRIFARGGQCLRCHGCFRCVLGIGHAGPHEAWAAGEAPLCTWE